MFREALTGLCLAVSANPPLALFLAAVVLSTAGVLLGAVHLIRR